MRSLGLAALTTAAIVIAGPAYAQAPQVEKNVSMAMAMAIVQGTIEQCTKGRLQGVRHGRGQGRQCRGAGSR